ncbi:hypothetical protein [Methylobacterium soli]|uniref:Uncharacterized protein n=1 Tax=Methylobacterium soli TaxID=553447 RepID=A0A6L3STL4_9HYPH|nr:hypothetical protein [Methylobacterium soli]KAB1076509.1 hypothetical protein F6X53_22655 [Methylobacterium soli]GJE44853.1 hypothetical protein AEGHOMDF_4044 [Methylobacterium soli]
MGFDEIFPPRSHERSSRKLLITLAMVEDATIELTKAGMSEDAGRTQIMVAAAIEAMFWDEPNVEIEWLEGK